MRDRVFLSTRRDKKTRSRRPSRRASTPPEGYAALIAQLAVRCAPGFRDERTTTPRSLLAPASGAYEFSTDSTLRLK